MIWFVQEKCSTWASPIPPHGLCRKPTHSPKSMAGARSLDCKSNTASRSANRNVICFRWRAPLTLASPHGLRWPVAFLSGKYAKGTKTNADTARFSSEGNPPDERKLRIGETVTQLANEIGRSASQVSLNWLRQRQAVVIPIIGARRTAQIEDNLKSLDW